MSDHIFQDAYARVRARYDDPSWYSLSPREITTMIYQEMRAIDIELLRRAPEVNPLTALAAE